MTLNINALKQRVKRKQSKAVLRSLTNDGQVIVEINGKVYEFWIDAALNWKIKWMFDRGGGLRAFALIKKIARTDRRREDLEDPVGNT